MKNHIIKLLTTSFLFINAHICYAQVISQSKPIATPPNDDNPVLERVQREEELPANSYSIAFHNPTYIMPYYYTGSPDNKIYRMESPEDEELKHGEMKYQISFKVPIWKNILNHPSTLFLAYTQLSYWQAYDHDPFFRETDYQPELFVANEINMKLPRQWQLNFFNIGVVHQSNGYGGKLERSWNRMYISGILSRNDWGIMIKPWIIFRDNTYQRQNPNLAEYLGYGQIVIVYKRGQHVFSITTQNLIESGGRRSGTTFSWSFPLTSYLRGYAQVFTGYGQSLIEYNHRTNSAVIGIALSDWV